MYSCHKVVLFLIRVVVTDDNYCVFERIGFRLEKAHLEQAVQLQKIQQENKKLDLYAPFFRTTQFVTMRVKSFFQNESMKMVTWGTYVVSKCIGVNEV